MKKAFTATLVVLLTACASRPPACQGNPTPINQAPMGAENQSPAKPAGTQAAADETDGNHDQ